MAVDAAAGRSRADLGRDCALAAAIERFVEIIGEAANRVTEQRKDAILSIPWRQIVGMRNRLIYGYGSIDQDILWNIVQDDLPALIGELEKALAQK